MIRLLLTSVAAVTLLAAPVAASAATKAHMKMKPMHTAMHGTKHTTMHARPADSLGTDALNDRALAAARGTGPAAVPPAK